jgi:hypothetical protein
MFNFQNSFCPYHNYKIKMLLYMHQSSPKQPESFN